MKTTDSKTVYYIGFYDGKYCQKRGDTEPNLAGSMKMDFIIQSLKKLGYNVIIVSLTAGDRCIAVKENYSVDEKESYIYLPYLAIPWRGRIKGCSMSLLYSLKLFARHNFNKDSIVISYHSLLYKNSLAKLHKRIKFHWYAQVEELYCMSRRDYFTPEILQEEEKMFDTADGFLFVNDIMKEKYSNGKKCVVSYGNYKFFSRRELKNPEIVNIAYTGIINEDRGIFTLMDAMQYLPANYRLNVLGYGLQQHMNAFLDRMKAINENAGYEKINFFGTKKGAEFSEFLATNDIGVSLMDVDDVVAKNAFPSKIMAYLGHSLYVVSSKCKPIVNSRIAPLLYFCDNHPEAVADTIKQVPVYEVREMESELENLEAIFLGGLQSLLEG